MSVYIAGSSKELDRCERVISTAREMGLHVTYAWPEAFRALQLSGRMELTRGEHLDQITRDLTGVRECRVFVLLASPHESEARVELGAAIALQKAIVISRETPRERFFDLVAAYEEATDVAALQRAAKLCGMMSTMRSER